MPRVRVATFTHQGYSVAPVARSGLAMIESRTRVRTRDRSGRRTLRELRCLARWRASLRSAGSTGTHTHFSGCFTAQTCVAGASSPPEVCLQGRTSSVAHQARRELILCKVVRRIPDKVEPVIASRMSASSRASQAAWAAWTWFCADLTCRADKSVSKGKSVRIRHLARGSPPCSSRTVIEKRLARVSRKAGNRVMRACSLPVLAASWWRWAVITAGPGWPLRGSFPAPEGYGMLRCCSSRDGFRRWGARCHRVGAT